MPRAVTIGNFDGVHRGHAHIVAAARRHGDVHVITFDPSPAVVLRGAVPRPLGTIERRRELLVAAGASEVHVIDPRDGFLEQSPAEFLDWLAGEFSPDRIVEGPDFRFGSGRGGSVRTLREAAPQHGWEVEVVDPVTVMLGDRTVVRASSSIVRTLLDAGRVDDAARVLGRPHRVSGIVRPGARKGRELGIPTANVDAATVIVPGNGIYAGTATDPDGGRHRAAISIGTRPTFDGATRAFEVHLIDYNGPVDVYEWTMTVDIERWLREQVRYASIDPLVAQIRRDIARARKEAG